MLYDAGEKGLTDKQIAGDRAFRNETAQRHCLQEGHVLDKAPGAVLQGGGHPGNAEIRFYQAARRYAGRVFRARPRPHGVYSRRYRACKADRRS